MRQSRAESAIGKVVAVVFKMSQKSDCKYMLNLDDVVSSRGGIPLTENGKIIGAIGCSGATGSQDEVVCAAAAALVNKGQ